MNEFEWRQQLRALRQPLAPQHDLWHSIDAALDACATELADTRSHSARSPWLLRASVAASLLVIAGIGWHLLAPARTPLLTPIASTHPWRPADPRLAGAAIELDAAQLELQLAIQQAPTSPALQRLLDRTERQQAQLRQLTKQAS